MWALWEQHPLLPQPFISFGYDLCCFSKPDIIGTPLPSAACLDWGAGVGLLQLWYLSHLWIATLWVWDLTRPNHCPSYLSWHCFFISLVTGILFSSSSGGSQQWLFYFDVFMGGGEFRILLYHLDLASVWLAMYLYDINCCQIHDLQIFFPTCRLPVILLMVSFAIQKLFSLM